MYNPWKALSKVNPQPSGNGTAYRVINAGVWCSITAAELSGPGYAVFMFILNQTWGYQKLSAKIGYASFRNATNLSRMSISKAIQQLKDSRIIVVEKGNLENREISEYMLNKHYDTWLTSKDVLTHTSKDVLTDLGTQNKESKKERDGIDSLLKENKRAPDRSDKNFKGKYGGMVVATASELQEIDSERAERMEKIEALQ